MSLHLQSYTQNDDMSTSDMSLDDILIQLNGFESQYRAKLAKTPNHNIAIAGLDQRARTRLLEVYRQAGYTFASETDQRELQSINRELDTELAHMRDFANYHPQWGKVANDLQAKYAERQNRIAEIRQIVVDNPPVPTKQEITESDINRAMYSLQVDYEGRLRSDEPTRLDAIQHVIEQGKRDGVNYIVPVSEPEQVINPFKRRSEISLTPNTRLEGINLLLFRKSMLTMIYGDTNSGKSTLMLHTSIQFAAKGHKTLFISTEDSLDTIRERVEVMRNEYSLDKYQTIDDNLMYASMETLREYAEANEYEDFAFDLIDDATSDLIHQIVEEYGIDTLFLDTLSGATLANESDNAQMNRAMRLLVDLSNNGVRVVFAHHTTKAGKDFSGAGTINRRVIDAFFLQAVGGNKITLTNVKAKNTAKGEYQTYTIGYKSVDVFESNEPITVDGRVMMLADRAVVTDAVETGSRKERIRLYLSTVESATTADIVEATGIKQPNTVKPLSQLVEERQIKKEGSSYSFISP